MNLKEFEPIFKNDIAPIYVKHKKEFDEFGIHGCLHISRSLIISRLLFKQLTNLGFLLDIDKITYAVAFHDSGRKANGIDYWEANSFYICSNYLDNKNIPDSNYISSLIIKDNNKNDYNYFCVYDTDVLEIARPCTGVGVYNFNPTFLKLKDIFSNHYTTIQNEVFSFILDTENIKDNFSNENSLINLIEYLENKKELYPLLYDASIS